MRSDWLFLVYLSSSTQNPRSKSSVRNVTYPANRKMYRLNFLVIKFYIYETIKPWQVYLPLDSSPSCKISAILKKFFFCSSFIFLPKFSRNSGGFCEMAMAHGLSFSQASLPPGYRVIMTWQSPWNFAIQSRTSLTNSRVRPEREPTNCNYFLKRLLVGEVEY